MNAQEYSIIPATKSEAEITHNSLVAFNKSIVPYTQEQPYIAMNYVAKDGEQIIAGVNAFLYGWHVLFVDILFVDEKHRKKNLGSALLSKVEKEAKAAGAKLAHLDTFDFQAKDFYLKHGYAIFGVLDDCPQGHKRYYLKKEL